MFAEVLRVSEDGLMTFSTSSAISAFSWAERMAFAGYSVKLSKEPGGDWVVVATKTGEVNQHASV